MLTPIYQVAAQEFFRANFWTFRMPNDPLIEFKVKSTTLPFEKLISKTLSSGQKVWEGWEGIETFTVEFYETATFSTYRYFTRWIDRFYDKTRRVFRLVNPLDFDAFRTCSISFYQGAGIVEVPLYNFVFSNVKVTEIAELNLSYESGDPLVYSVTFVADEYIQF